MAFKFAAAKWSAWSRILMIDSYTDRISHLVQNQPQGPPELIKLLMQRSALHTDVCFIYFKLSLLC